jgi:hypothetical protein
MKVDANLLAHRLRDDRKTQKPAMVDAHGAFVAGKRGDQELSPTWETFAKLTRAGPRRYGTSLSRPIELR